MSIEIRMWFENGIRLAHIAQDC